MNELELPKRFAFQKVIVVQSPGDTLVWEFYTKRKDINFGVFHTELLSQTTATEKLFALANKTVGPVDAAQEKTSSAKSTDDSGKKLVKVRSSQVETNASTFSKTASASTIGSHEERGPSIENITSFKQIVKVERYKCDREVVKGSYVAINSGLYIFYWDNAHAKKSSKHLCYMVTLRKGGRMPDQTQHKDPHRWCQRNCSEACCRVLRLAA